VVGLAFGGKRVDPDDALDLVGYYGVGCDLTRRDLQSRAKEQRKPWDAAKSFDFSAPCGPFVPAGHQVLGDGCHLPGDCVMELTKNGEVQQRTPLNGMIFSVAEAIAHLSNESTLCAGDVIFTGTPAGVGKVDHGDEIECTVKSPDGRFVVPPCRFLIGA